MLDQWAASPLSCRHDHCHRHAHVVVVPSVFLRCTAPSGDAPDGRTAGGFQGAAGGFKGIEDGTMEPHHLFWRHVGRRTSSSQLVVIHGHDSWDTPYGGAMLTALSQQPADLIRRVVLVSMEDPFQHCRVGLASSFRARSALPASKWCQPQFSPPTIALS